MNDKTWVSVTLPYDVQPLDGARITELLEDVSRMSEAERTDLLRQAIRLATADRSRHRREGARARSVNVRLTADESLALVRYGGSVTQGYRMLRCLDGAVTDSQPKYHFGSYSLHHEMLSKLPDKIAGCGDLLVAAVTAFRANPPNNLEDFMRRNEAVDWGLKQTKERTYSMNFRVTPSVHAYLKDIGKGNASRAVRAVLRWALEQTA